jgi:predicted nucleic acid-binding protein
MSEATAHLIETYCTGTERLAEAIRGWSDADLRKVPSETASADVGKWSVHQLVIHLADAELALGDRIRRVIAMNQPALLAWDEDAFFERLHYNDQSIADAIELIHLTRRQVGRILQKTPDSDFERIGIHNQRGPQSLSTIIGFADAHMKHHLSFVQKKRVAFKI